MRKLLSITLAFVLCISLAVSSASAAGTGETVVATAEELQAAFNKGGNITLGGDIGSKDTLTVRASASLDLNGYKLTVITSQNSAFVIDLGQTLTISDSQYNTFVPGNGKLLANGYRAGIQTSGGSLIINSGVVEATGQWATGIGGIDKIGYNDGGTVTINDGIVTATGGCPGTFGGAGIGGMGQSGNGGVITINNGTVVAAGGKYGAGIGGGGSAGTASWVDAGGSGGTITINGGTVKARGNWNGAADIGGGGHSVDGGSLKITGGTVELLNSGTNATASLKNCTIMGDGAGDYRGSYDSSGNRIVVTGASAWASENVASAMARNLVPLGLQSDYTKAATRAEFCALAVALYETVTGREITQRKTFADTTDINVEKMGALNVVSGVGTDRFNPDGTLTREQAAAMIARLAAAVGEPLPEAGATFSDKTSISPWAANQVGQVQAANIMGGVGNNLFAPAGTYTREQSIITMLRLFNAVK